MDDVKISEGVNNYSLEMIGSQTEENTEVPYDKMQAEKELVDMILEQVLWQNPSTNTEINDNAFQGIYQNFEPISN